MKKLKKYIYLLLVLLVAALNFNLILKPLKLVVGGTQGVAVILNHLLKLSPSLIILIVNVLMLIISFFTLKKETTLGTVEATFMYPILVKLTSFIPSVKVDGVWVILLVILAGIVCGVTGGLVYRLGFSNGGVSVLPLLIEKYFSIHVYLSTFIINGIIVLLGIIYFGILKGVYSVIIVLLQSYLIKKVLSFKKRNVYGKSCN